MQPPVADHYAGQGDLTSKIERMITSVGKDVTNLTVQDAATLLPEFHIRGRSATIEHGERMELSRGDKVLDVGSGLGGSARTLASTFQCDVTGIDLTPSHCDAASAISRWLGMSGSTRFVTGDATDLPFEPESFDAAMTIHTAMNIRDKTGLYAGVRRVLKPGRIFAVYDVLQGDGGEVIFPVPWARDPSISHLATPGEMRELLTTAGFEILSETDSSEPALTWFRALLAQVQQSGTSPVLFQVMLGDDFPEMARSQVRNLSEDRIRTVTYICRA